MERFREACTIFSWSRWFVTHRKKFEEVDFVDKEFQHKKINNTFKCVLWCATEDTLEDTCSYKGSLDGLSGVRHYGDLAALN